MSSVQEVEERSLASATNDSLSQQNNTNTVSFKKQEKLVLDEHLNTLSQIRTVSSFRSLALTILLNYDNKATISKIHHLSNKLINEPGWEMLAWQMIEVEKTLPTLPFEEREVFLRRGLRKSNPTFKPKITN